VNPKGKKPRLRSASRSPRNGRGNTQATETRMELRADGQADVYNHGHLVFTAVNGGVLDMNLLKVASLFSLCCALIHLISLTAPA